MAYAVMSNSTVIIRFPGFTVRRTPSATRLRMVTVTLTNDPADGSDPDAGDTVTLTFGSWITKWTGPPTAIRTNVPVAGWPATPVITSLVGTARTVP